MKSSRHEKDIKENRNLFRLKNETGNTAVKDKINLFTLKNENNAVKNRIIRDIRSLFENEEEYYKPVRVGNLWSNNYIEYESNSDKYKTLSVEEYILHNIRLYLKDIINNLKKSDTGKIQLTIAIDFISSKGNDEEHVMHSKKDNIEIMINGKTDGVTMRGSDFEIDYVHYKRHKINFKRDRSYIDSPDWIKSKKATINPINKTINASNIQLP